MLKRIIVASALAVFSIGAAGCAQSFATRHSASVSTMPGLFAAVQVCEAQKGRQATLVKQLAANYDTERAHNECVASASEAVASK